MDVVALVNGIWQSQYSFLIVLRPSSPGAVEFGLLPPPPPHHRGDDAQQLAAGAAGLNGNRAVARLRLHHLDGLRNFTSAPLLSVFIAFGIQGVMLIVAWLIGESFASGMNQRIPGCQRLHRA